MFAAQRLPDPLLQVAARDPFSFFYESIILLNSDLPLCRQRHRNAALLTSSSSRL